MTTFSQRKGLKPVRDKLQVDGMDDTLRAQLWNVLHIYVWNVSGFLRTEFGGAGRIAKFAETLWFTHFKKPFTTIPAHPNQLMEHLETYFFGARWNEVYDFLEAVIAIIHKPDLVRSIDFVLEKEWAGYRLIDGRFVDVTDPIEIEELERALHDDRFAPVSQHLSRALELMTDRKNPDFRNSIKESISAVESVAKLLTKNEKASLSDAIRILEQKGRLHPALREAFSRLYGYTSDEHGIRHAMLEEPNLTAADAKFFLVSCASFVNYLKAQSDGTV